MSTLLEQKLTTKLCLKCKTEKSLSSFETDSSKPDGFKSWCRDCCQSVKKDQATEEKLLSLEDMKAQKERLEREIIRLESEAVSQSRPLRRIDDFASLKPEERLDTKSFYHVVNRNNNTIFEWNGANVSKNFGNNIAKRKSFANGIYGSTVDHDGFYISFLYRECK